MNEDLEEDVMDEILSSEENCDLFMEVVMQEIQTDEEMRIQAMLAEGFFPITSVCRDDLLARGFDTDRVTDEQMQELARRMANDYCEQLFWDSMEIIAELMGIPKRKVDFCPKCESELVYFDVTTGLNRCSNCGQEWDNNTYAMVEFPDDGTYFEQEEIGYPVFDREDNGARLVPEYEYMLQYGRTPDREKCYRAVEWPASQQFIGNEECLLVNDDEGLERFGSSAYWVPVKLLEKV